LKNFNDISLSADAIIKHLKLTFSAIFKLGYIVRGSSNIVKYINIAFTPFIK